VRRRQSLGIEFNSESVRLVLLRKEWKRVSLAAHAVIPRGEGANGDEAVAGEIARLVPPAARRSTRVALGFPRDAAVASRLDLPPVSTEKLTQLLRFELDRHLPVSPESFRCALRIQERAADRTSGFLVALPLSVMERPLGVLRRAGLTPAVIDLSPFPLLAHLQRRDALLLSLGGKTADLFSISGGNLDRWRPIILEGEGDRLAPVRAAIPHPEGEAPIPLLVQGAIGDEELAALAETTERPVERVALFPGLLPADGDPSLGMACALALEGLRRRPAGLIFTGDPSQRATAWAKWRKPAIAASIILGVGGATLGTAVIVRDHMTLKSLQEEISRLEPEGRQAEAVRSRRDLVKRTVDLVAGFQRNEVLKIELLRELSQVIPDEAWLTGLAYRQGQVELSGLARSASALVPVLEGSAVLKGVSLEGAVTREGAQERFTLRATVRPSFRPSPGTPEGESS
jgi:Tfp pilus assembly protein PilN